MLDNGKRPLTTQRMNTFKPSAGSDWTKILSDPTIAEHLGELLKAYREAPPEKREQALLDAMRRIKGTKSQAAAAGVSSATTPGVVTAVATSAAPPFELDFFAPSRGQDRRRFPRMKCFVAVELRIEGSFSPAWGNLSNLSPGGCFVETATPFNPGIKVGVGLWIANGELWVKGLVLNGIVTSSNPSSGIRIKFDEMESNAHETLKQFLNYVVETTRNQENTTNYLAQIKR